MQRMESESDSSVGLEKCGTSWEEGNWSTPYGAWCRSLPAGGVISLTLDRELARTFARSGQGANGAATVRLVYSNNAAAGSTCWQALVATCGQHHTGSSNAECRLCVGQHQHELRHAGCSSEAVSDYCDTLEDAGRGGSRPGRPDDVDAEEAASLEVLTIPTDRPTYWRLNESHAYHSKRLFDVTCVLE